MKKNKKDLVEEIIDNILRLKQVNKYDDIERICIHPNLFKNLITNFYYQKSFYKRDITTIDTFLGIKIQIVSYMSHEGYCFVFKDNEKNSKNLMDLEYEK